MNAVRGQLCPVCDGADVRTFYELSRVPVHSVLTLPTRQEALGYPSGDIALTFCNDCGFIYNAAFEPDLLEYSSRYDPTQAFSPTFNAWHRSLAAHLVERYHLRGRRVIEIGCGKGEFLHLLCSLGDVDGIGFDPAYEAGRDTATGGPAPQFIADFYSEKYADVQGDLVCCKMTLEHIQSPQAFLRNVRRTIGNRLETAVFFQVPDVLRILRDNAFWDIYYEHCSYFSAGSLTRLFRRCGFDVLEVARDYGDQYLWIDARPSGSSPPQPEENDTALLRGLVDRFERSIAYLKHSWRMRLSDPAAVDCKTVLWGSGSKGVAFLTTLGLASNIEYVVDVNPHRQGGYMLGTGQRIVGPDFLANYVPDRVVIMNPIYRDEIVADLLARGLRPEVWTT